MCPRVFDRPTVEQPEGPPVIRDPVKSHPRVNASGRPGVDALGATTWAVALLAAFLVGALSAYVGMTLGGDGADVEPSGTADGAGASPAVPPPSGTEEPDPAAVTKAATEQGRAGPPGPSAAKVAPGTNAEATADPAEAPRPSAPAAVAAQGAGAAILPDDTAVEVRALAGEPFGVGKITVDFPEGRRPTWHADQPIQLQGDRVLYPAVKTEYAFAPGESQSQVDRYQCYFLFRGGAPMKLALAADATHRVEAAPVVDDAEYDALLQAWWREYSRPRRVFSARYDRPAVARDYLTRMLARRLGLSRSAIADRPAQVDPAVSVAVVRGIVQPLVRLLVPMMGSPAARPARLPVPSSAAPSAPLLSTARGSMVFDFDRFLGFLFGTESLRLAFLTETTLAQADRHETADRPLPRPMSLPPVPIPSKLPRAEIEPISLRVPCECFYLRCGSLAEYLWLRNLLVRWGGSFNDLVSTEAIDHQVRPRIERQLALSADAEMRGELDKLISDMALIGTDVLFHDGAALGVLFEAAEGAGPELEKLIRRQRAKTAAACPEAVEQERGFRGGTASLLATPDHRVRSFYAIDGRYHLVTSSSYIAGRFLKMKEGRGSLGRTDEFRYARSKMPRSRDDAVFIYLSDPFFRLVVSPQYRIEMTRRAQAIRDAQHVNLARLAAGAEGAPGGSVQALIDGGFLPPPILTRPDGSRPVLCGDRVCDSLRGARGTFLPIPDVVVPGATASEVESYHRFARDYRAQWRRMDPVSIGVRHGAASAEGREKVAIDVHITPYARENYERLFMNLDPPDALRLAPVSGDLMRVEARLRGLSSYLPGLRAEHPRAFAAMRDFAAPLRVAGGEVKSLSLSPLSLLGTDYECYAGVEVDGSPWTKVRGDGHPRRSDSDGYSFVRRTFPALLGWRRTWNRHWAAWAHDRGILESVTPQLRLEPAERKAQVRFYLGDVAASKLGPAVQAICYMHARRISALNAAEIHEMMEQFRVGPDEARRAAEGVHGGRLICPLSGKYQVSGDGGPPRWTSTAWPRPSVFAEDRIPEDYCHPFVGWLRGASMEMMLTDITLSSHVELEVESSADRAAAPGVVLASHEALPQRGPALAADPEPQSPQPDSPNPAGQPADAERIQGTWEVIDDRRSGRPLAGTEGARLRFTAGELVQVRDGEEKLRFRFRLRPESEPRGFDFLPAGRRLWDERGIYRLQGDRLLLCYGRPDDPRPEQFETRSGDGRRVVVLQRVGPAD